LGEHHLYVQNDHAVVMLPMFYW